MPLTNSHILIRTIRWVLGRTDRVLSTRLLPKFDARRETK